MLNLNGSPNMSELKLRWSETSKIADAFRDMDQGASSMEEVAERMVQYLYDHLESEDKHERACALVRFFKTEPYGKLRPHLQQYIKNRFGEPDTEQTPCLTLLASRGMLTEWNSRYDSVNHQCIPLNSPDLLSTFPMIGQLLHQFGVDLSELVPVEPSVVLKRDEKTYNVFHVEDALKSPYIPDKENFVIPYGIKSIVGFGGVLPLASMFAIILFSRAPIKREVAQLFMPLALSAKNPLLSFAGRPFFAR